MKKFYGYVMLLLVIATLNACQKKNGTVVTSELKEYLPLQLGKYIRYQLDSTIYINFGQKDTVISYDAKDVVEAEITENQSRPTYRVVRYLRPLSSTDENDYTPTLTYTIVPTRECMEVMENNLRYQKLRLPVAVGFNWHGNSALPSTPFYELYQFSNDEDMDVWDYTYTGVNESFAVGNTVYENTTTVLQVADSSNVPIEFPDGLAYRNYWTETYAKNIGLIYKEVVMWEYQPSNSGNPPFRSGFGLKMTIIDHN